MSYIEHHHREFEIENEAMIASLTAHSGTAAPA